MKIILKNDLTNLKEKEEKIKKYIEFCSDAQREMQDGILKRLVNDIREAPFINISSYKQKFNSLFDEYYQKTAKLKSDATKNFLKILDEINKQKNIK